MRPLHIDTPPQDPLTFDGHATVVSLWAAQCARLGGRVCHREKTLGVWEEYSWTQYYEAARAVGLALLTLGVKAGEPVLILSEDRREWLYCDLGIAAIGAIPTGVYTTSSATQLAYLASDSGARVLIVENDEQLDKWLESRAEMPGIEHVIVMDREGLATFSDPQVMFYDRLIEIGSAELAAHPGLFEARLQAVKPEDPRMLIYTSGTTGHPKGAVITHRNVIFQLGAWEGIFDYKADDELLCFLPLCHALERLVSVESPIARGCTVNFAESPETVFDNLREVSPHAFTGVPRIWEKIYSRVTITRSEAGRIGGWIFDRAVASGLAMARAREEGRAPGLALRLGHALADWLVLSNLRRMLGLSRLHLAITGAAPVAPDVIRWFNGIGVPLIEGWGLTECTGVGTANRRDLTRIGTVGPAIHGVELRLGQGGEIEIGGPAVFGGYWNKPDKTAETLTEDGWLKTGDVGRIDNHGCLSITGRIKDIIITSGGKNITPAQIESRLKVSPYVSDALVIGDAKPYLTCLIMIDQENVETFARDQQIPFSDFASLTRADEVRALIGGVVEAANKDFAQVEKIKDFRLIDILLTPEDDELTPTMKLKRSFVNERHAALIASMY